MMGWVWFGEFKIASWCHDLCPTRQLAMHLRSVAKADFISYVQL